MAHRAALEVVCWQYITSASKSAISRWDSYYELIKPEGRWMGGCGGIGSICDEIRDTGLLSQDMRDQITLTDLGHRFATWLTKNEKKATYFKSTLGTWGRRPQGLPQRDLPFGFPGTFSAGMVSPESQATPPSAGSPTGETIRPPDLSPGFPGTHSARRTPQEQMAATVSPGATTIQTAQASEAPRTDPTVESTQATQISSDAT